MMRICECSEAGANVRAFGIIAHIDVDASDERGLQRRVVKRSPGDDLAELTVAVRKLRGGAD